MSTPKELKKEVITRYKRQKACELMDELREKANIKMTIKEMIRRKNYGRP